MKVNPPPTGATTPPELPTLDQYRNLLKTLTKRELTHMEEAELWRLRALRRWPEPAGTGRSRLWRADAEVAQVAADRLRKGLPPLDGRVRGPGSSGGSRRGDSLAIVPNGAQGAAQHGLGHVA